MPLADQIRAVFQEGERLTARRLNIAVDYLRASLRRVLVAPLSPGVANGLVIATTGKPATLAVSKGIAIDRRGRLIVLDAIRLITQSQIADAVGTLNSGDMVRVGIGLSSSDSLDPCGPARPLDIIELPTIVFRKYTPTPGPLLPFSTVCVDTPAGDLDAMSSDPDGCSVELGFLTMTEEGSLDASMSTRMGVSPHVDSLRDSFGFVVQELRTRQGNARTNFVAPAGGWNVQATRLAQAHSPVAAARVSPLSGELAEFAGGTATATLPPGFGGIAAVPLAVQPGFGSIGPGTVVELYADDDPAPVKPVAVIPLGEDPSRAFGLVAGLPYPDASGTFTIAPIAVAGVLLVPVAAPGDIGYAAGTPLKAGSGALAAATVSTDVVVAIAAQNIVGTGSGPVLGHIFVVHPPRKLGS